MTTNSQRPFLKEIKVEHVTIPGRHAREAEFSADHLIFRQGENAHQFHLVLEPTRSILLYGPRIREECEKNHEFGYALLKQTGAVVIQRLQATRKRLVELSAIESIEPSNFVTA